MRMTFSSATKVSHDLSEILSSEECNFLIRNKDFLKRYNDEQVKISTLLKKTVMGLYFASSSLPRSQSFTGDSWNSSKNVEDLETILKWSLYPLLKIVGLLTNLIGKCHGSWFHILGAKPDGV
ncbi:hypothetical protein FNV43_RR22454 [Rhamnella rubrinervis]|uniref:Uncharacterized protein n=1 Tax=Rhamnella rubrinervis TaxID=2594499 RepID=A0A8K0DQI4_9ROSA|nr:hypothetical protein FNV43_RR22454 [Rhamnella rubrinervis]